jgi:hypothetical protein
LALGHLSDDVSDLLADLLKGVQIAWLGVFGEGLHVDQADLSGFGRFVKLLEQLVDLLEFLLELDRLGDIDFLTSGENVFA